MTGMESMIREIEAEVRYTSHLTGRNTMSQEILDALRQVPRHAFVPDNLINAAYDNRPLPIGKGQTISQPYIVAIMTELLDIEPENRVLEVGTGSGYQTAILAQLAQHVFSLEIIPALSKKASQRLNELGYHNITTGVGDAYQGWPKYAPFNAIMVTAAAPHIPQPLVDQLAPGGRMVIPVGGGFGQDLLLISKQQDNQIQHRTLLPVAFVPLTRTYGPGAEGRH